MEKVVCLLSGGIDSAVTAAIAKSRGYKIHTITFDYGQKHKKEIKCAEEIAKWLNSEHKVIKADLTQIGGSALTDDIEIPEKWESIPVTYVPARNTIFLSYAVGYAEVIDANAVFIGVNSFDYAGYPDCRKDFIDAFQKAINLGTKRGVEGREIKIETPIIDLTKAEIIKKGIELSVPFEKTWSCYNGRKKACGKCPSCRIRIKGFKEAGFVDPIEYENK